MKSDEKAEIVIEASPQACFDALTDYDTFTEWQEAVETCEVLSRDAQGRGHEVQYMINARVKKINYRLAYSYEEPNRITWDYLGGDVKEVDGEYTFDDQGDGTTLATYALVLDPGVWVPPPLAKVLREQVMKRSMVELKKRVESL